VSTTRACSVGVSHAASRRWIAPATASVGFPRRRRPPRCRRNAPARRRLSSPANGRGSSNGLVRSKTTGNTRGDSLPSAVNFSVERPTANTRCPRAASARAMAVPIPPVAPVTTAVCLTAKVCVRDRSCRVERERPFLPKACGWWSNTITVGVLLLGATVHPVTRLRRVRA
jgi:hypothetical protein